MKAYSTNFTQYYLFLRIKQKEKIKFLKISLRYLCWVKKVEVWLTEMLLMYYCWLIGTKEDRVLASSIAVLLCVQFGAGSESEDVFRSMKPHLITVVQDQTAGSVARASVRKTIMCFDKNVMVNFKPGQYTWKMSFSQWHRRLKHTSIWDRFILPRSNFLILSCLLQMSSRTEIMTNLLFFSFSFLLLLIFNWNVLLFVIFPCGTSN